MEGTFELHQAVQEEREMIEGILHQAALWIQSKGSKQWNGMLDQENKQDNHDTIGALQRGEVYFATIDEEPAGMFILWDQQSEWDQELWSEQPGNEYMYLHRLAIMREFAGTGLSGKLVQAALKLAKDKEKKAVRLDCLAQQPYLNHLYQKEGFELVGTVLQHHAGEQVADFNLYQNNLSDDK